VVDVLLLSSVGPFCLRCTECPPEGLPDVSCCFGSASPSMFSPRGGERIAMIRFSPGCGWGVVTGAATSSNSSPHPPPASPCSGRSRRWGGCPPSARPAPSGLPWSKAPLPRPLSSAVSRGWPLSSP
jgi:hypothetical protein